MKTPEKGTRPISSHLDRESMVKKGFIKKQVGLTIMGIKNDLFIPRATNGSQLCLKHNKPNRFAYVFFIFTVPFRIMRLFCRYSQKSTKFVSLLHAIFLAWNQIGQSLEYNIGPSCPLKQLIWSQDSLNAVQCISSLMNESRLSKFLGWYSLGLDITRPVTLFPTRFTCVELRIGSP